MPSSVKSADNMVDFTVYKGSEGGKIVKGTSSRSIGPNDVLIKVTHSGLCFTDVHYKEADIVLGHEGAGLVQDIGSNVTLFKKGDRVGWGYNHSCCGHCKQCLRGMDTFCPERAMYGSADFDQGSFASHAVWNQNFVYHVPDALESVYAAPLMCGGATVFNALHLHGLKPYDRVGIIGVGGLGHLAIQFAAKMGCTVVVFSGSDSKKEEAMKLGATEFYAVKGVKSGEELKKIVKAEIEYLIVTTSSQPDWSVYQPIMAGGGTICPLSVSSGNLVMPYTPLIEQGLRIQGSLVADRLTHQRMLAFAAQHSIHPIIQTFPLNEKGIEEAFGVLESGKMRYRGVLVAEE